MAHFRNVTLFALAPLFVGSVGLAVMGGLSTSGCEAYHNEAERAAYKRQLDAEEKHLYPDVAAAGAAGASAYTYIGAGYNPPDPTQCPNNHCLPDPGSRLISAGECKQVEAGLEFLALPIWDFEDDRDGYNDKDKDRLWDRPLTDHVGIKDWDRDGRTDEEIVHDERFALLGYTYSDDTTYNYYPFGWEPPTIADPFSRCERKDNHVFHVAGGPFLEWGGGLGRALRCMNNTTGWSVSAAQGSIDTWRNQQTGIDPNENTIGTIYCHAGASKGATANVPAGCDVAETNAVVGGICPQRDRLYKKTKIVDPPEDAAVLGMAVDVSAWEGIAFWARRGPNSQAGFRLLVGDKRTDDDISYMQYLTDPSLPRYCERMFECKCKSASRPCTVVTEDEVEAINASMNLAHTDMDGTLGTKSYWEDPNSYNLNPIKAGESLCWDRNDPNSIAIGGRTQICGQSTCVHQSDSAKSLNVSADPFTVDTTCQQYTFRGSIQTDICYDPKSTIPAQQIPAEASQVCGDHWMKSIELSLDWQFYMVPFTELLQQGWAKRSYELDLTALTLARFTWDRGFIDYYIDDVRFYRKKQ